MIFRKYLQGGNALPAFVHYTPVEISNTRAQESDVDDGSSKKGKEKSDELSDKDLIKALESLDGLPNEVQAIKLDLQRFLVNKSMSLSGMDSSRMNLEYLEIVSKLKVAKFNSKEYENAYNQIKSNGGINEIAVDTDGNVICRSLSDPNDFLQLSAQQYLANRDKYKALTNQELLNLRAQAPQLVNKNEVLLIVGNGMGMLAILLMINSAILGIGTSTTQIAGYTRTLQQQIQQGAEYLEEAKAAAAELGLDESQMSVDGLYNVGVLNKTLMDQAKMALSYIYSVLPKGAKALLEIKAAEGGVAGGVAGLLTLLVGSKLSYTTTEKIQRSNDPEAAAAKKKKKGEEEEIDPALEGPLAKLKLTPVMMALLGKSDRMVVNLMAGTKYKSLHYALVVPIVDSNGNALNANTTLDKVASSQFAGALDTTSASMGGKTIKDGALKKVAVTSNRMAIMNIPIDQERYALDGAIVPDLRYLTKLEEADKKVRELLAQKGDAPVTPQEMNQIYQSMGLPVVVDQNGNLNVTQYCKFAALNGQIKDAYLDPGGLDIIALDISDSASINSYLSIINDGESKADKEEFDENNWYDVNGHDTLYKSTIFIPFNTNILNGAMTSKLEIESKDAAYIQAATALKERLQGYQDGMNSRYNQ